MLQSRLGAPTSAGSHPAGGCWISRPSGFQLVRPKDPGRGPTSDASVVPGRHPSQREPQRILTKDQGCFRRVPRKELTIRSPRRLHPKRRPSQPLGECRLNHCDLSFDHLFTFVPLARSAD